MMVLRHFINFLSLSVDRLRLGVGGSILTFCRVNTGSENANNGMKKKFATGSTDKIVSYLCIHSCEKLEKSVHETKEEASP